MDIAALIFAPLLLALIYSWSGINRLPSLARMGLPVALMAILFVALLGYGPAVQEAVATRTPLVRQIEGLPLSFHVDGLSLLFGLIIIGLGAMSTLYAGSFFAEGDYHRRFVRIVLALTGSLLGLVLTDYAATLPLYWGFTGLCFSSLIDFGRQNTASFFYRRVWAQVHLARFVTLLFAMKILEVVGASAKGMTESLVHISELSTTNMSHSTTYSLLLGVLLFWFILDIMFAAFKWYSGKHMSNLAHASLTATPVLSSTYILTRLYPAIHDNPLWWSVVTGVGLLLMLIGAVWTLRQREPGAILIYRTMSAFGACVALLGLPEFLGYKVALIGIVAHALSGAALFLSLDISRQRARWMILGLALLPIAIFHVLMIGAFAQLTLAWAGIALAVVMVSTALWVVSAIKIMRDETGRPSGSPLQSRRPIVDIVAGILALGALASAALFDTLVAPLLNPILMPKGTASDLTMPLILSVLAIIGGGILYATYGNKPHPRPLPAS